MFRSFGLILIIIFFQFNANSNTSSFTQKVTGASSDGEITVSSFNSLDTEAASFTVVDRRYGVVKIGRSSTSINSAWVNAGSNASWGLGSVVFTPGPGFSITTDGCSNVTLQDGQTCSFEVEFTSTTTGNFSASAKIGGMIVPYDPELPAYYNEVTWNFSAKARNTDIPPKCSATESGSIVRIDNLSVSEVFPLVGTEFDLYYSSEFAAEYQGSIQLTKNSFFAPELLTISAQHFYDVSNSRLFYGTGTSAGTPHVVLADTNLQVISVDGAEVYIFNSVGKHLQTKNILTGSIKYTFNYDGNNKLQSIVDAFGNSTTINRNTTGLLTGFNSPYNLLTTVGLNSAGNVSSVTNPKLETYNMIYKTGTELLEIMTKPKGQTSTFTYDLNGKLIKDESSAGNSLSFNLSDLTNGQRISMTTERGFETNFDTYLTDSEHYRRVTTYPSGDITNFTEYFELGGQRYIHPTYTLDSETVNDERFGSGYKRKSFDILNMNGINLTTDYTQVVTPAVLSDIFTFNTISKVQTTLGATLTQLYDSASRLFTTTSSSGKITKTKINLNEQIVEAQVGNYKKWLISYDTRGRVARTRQVDKKDTRFYYNAKGFLRQTRNALSEITNYIYSDAGLLTRITLPDSRVINYQYDTNGNLIGVTPPGRPKHFFVYNLYDLISSYLPPAVVGLINKNTVYTYNLDRKLTKIDRPDGIDINYVYSSATDRLDNIGTTNGSWGFTYSPTGQVASINSPDGIRTNYTYYGPSTASETYVDTINSTTIQSINFSFNNKHLKSSRTVIGATPITYSYNDDNVPTKIGDMTLVYLYPSGLLRQTKLNNIRDNRTYDTYGDLLSYEAVHLPSSLSLYKYELTRDLLGRVITKLETYGTQTSAYVYTYDSVGRLSSVTKDSLPYGNYTYDTNSNRVSGSVGGLVTNEAFTATYDAQDRLTTYNSNDYIYNENGELLSKELNSTDSISFEYDAFGNLKTSTLPSGEVLSYSLDGSSRRMVKLIDGAPVGYSIYEGSHTLAAEYNGLQVLQKEYVGGVNINSSDYVIVGITKYRIIKNHLGSPVLVVNSSTGQIVQEVHYNEFGKILSDSNPGFQPYGFAGGIYDQDTKLTRFGARDYDAKVGRWISKDPIRFDGGDVNLYGYVLQDPINLFDPNGLSDMNLIPPGEPAHTWDNKTKNTLGDYSVSGHGNSESMMGDDYSNISVEELASRIKKDTNYNKKDSIQLNSCETGKGENSFAERLSKALNTEVSAPDNLLNIDENGKLEVVQPGKWRKFTP